MIRAGFVVHPLAAWQLRLAGVRLRHLPMTFGAGAGADAVGIWATLHLQTPRGEAELLIAGVPAPPAVLRERPEAARAWTLRAANALQDAGVQAIGLGQVLPYLTERGDWLAERIDVPVTTGWHATTWAAVECVSAHAQSGAPVGVLGVGTPVGFGIACLLQRRGWQVHAVASTTALGKRLARAHIQAVPIEALCALPCLVGAETLGPAALPVAPGPRLLVDLALPHTLDSPPAGLQVLSGEALTAPSRLRGGFWGTVWLGMSGYGRERLFACAAAPLVAALGQPVGPARRWPSGEAAVAMGEALRSLGFVPATAA